MKLFLFICLVCSPLFGGEIEIFPNFIVYTGMGGNVSYIETDDGNVLINSGSPEYAMGVIEKAPEVKYLLTTHKHKEHTGGNTYYSETGALVVTHEKARKHLKSIGLKKDGDNYISFEDTYKMNVGGEDIKLIYQPNAHVDGYYIVYFPRRNVIHAANISNGNNIDVLINTSKELINLTTENIVVIPGHGDLLTKADIDMYIDIHTRIRGLKEQGYSLKQIIKSTSEEKEGLYNWYFPDSENIISTYFKKLR